MITSKIGFLEDGTVSIRICGMTPGMVSWATDAVVPQSVSFGATWIQVNTIRDMDTLMESIESIKANTETEVGYWGSNLEGFERATMRNRLKCGDRTVLALYRGRVAALDALAARHTASPNMAALIAAAEHYTPTLRHPELAAAFEAEMKRLGCSRRAVLAT